MSKFGAKATIGFFDAALPFGGSPTLFLSTLAISLALERSCPQPLFGDAHASAGRRFWGRHRGDAGFGTWCKTRGRWVLASALALYGLLGALASLGNMVGTGVLHSKQTTRLQTQGLYAVCRNPIYSFVLYVYCGVALAHNSRWVLLAAAACGTWLNAFVIPREEAFLANLFEVQVLNAYIDQVPRWCKPFDGSVAHMCKHFFYRARNGTN